MSGSAGGIRAGKAYVEIYGDKAPLAKTLDKEVPGLLASFKNEVEAIGKSISKSAGSWFGGLTVTAGDIVGAISAVTGFAGDVVGLGGDLQDMSDRTGLSIESLGELGHAAGLTGASLSDVEAGSRKMQDTLAQAAAGSDTAQAALRKLGVTSAELAGMTPDQQMAKLADGIAAIKDPAQRTAAVMDVFGKSGTKLLPMLQGGAAGMEEFREQARKMGRLTTEQAASLDNLGDSADVLKSTGFNAMAQVVAAATPVLQEMFDVIQWGATAVSEFLHSYQPAIDAIAKSYAESVKVATSWETWAEILGGLDAIAESTFGSIWGSVRDYFGKIYGVASETIAAISDALQAGDLEAAANVAMTGMYSQFLSYVTPLKELWIDVTSAFEDAWITSQSFVFDKFTGWTTSIYTLFNDVVATIQDIWDSFFSYLEQTFTSIQEWIGTLDADAAAAQRTNSADLRDKAIGSRATATDAINRDAEAASTRDREAIAKRANDRRSAIESERQAALKAAQDAREEAQRAFETARNAASQSKAAYDQQQADKAKQGQAAAQVAMSAAGSGAFSVGQLAFGGAGLSQGMFGGAFDKLTASSEEVARNTRALVRQGDEGTVGV